MTSTSDWDEESDEFQAEKAVWLERTTDNEECFDSLFDRIMHRPHDYGTRVWAAVAAMKKAFHLVDRTGQIISEQLPYVMWLSMKHIFKIEAKYGFTLKSYDWMLTPEGMDNFFTMPKFIRDTLMRDAGSLLQEHEAGKNTLSVSYREHLAKIASGEAFNVFKVYDYEE